MNFLSSFLFLFEKLLFVSAFGWSCSCLDTHSKLYWLCCLVFYFLLFCFSRRLFALSIKVNRG